MTERPAPNVMGELEDLREALFLSEQRRQDEEHARRESESLLAGMRMLSNADTVPSVFDGILDVIRKIVPFRDAAVLIEDEAGDGFEVLAATDDDCVPKSLSASGLFGRVKSGRPAVVMNLEHVPAWVDARSRRCYQSALVLPITTRRRTGMFICLSDEVSAYSKRHLSVLEFFTPLAAQALQRAEEFEARDERIATLTHLSRHDALTGAANRSLLDTRLEEAIAVADRDGTSVGVLQIDVDHFKTVNDTLGHAVGDVILQTIVRRLWSGARPIDTVARVGGDEFVVVLPNLAGRADAKVLADDLMKHVLGPVEGLTSAVDVEVSGGLAVYPDEPTPERLLNSADLALYESKGTGRHRVSVFDDAMRADFDHRLRLEGELRAALRNDELVLHYQPIFDVGNPEPMGLEALVRWQHPERGLLLPGEFIDVAEQAGLILPLGRWVLETAVAELHDWLAERPGRRVSINVARRELYSRGFVAKVADLLFSTGLPGSAIELELSEDVIAQTKLDHVMTSMRRLANLGVQFAFDDFGHGWASIHQLRTFPGQRLKIDRRFVDRLLIDDTDRAVIIGMIRLAHGLGLRVVGEGIETTAQLDALIEMGCDELQGFHLGRPVPFAQVVYGSAALSLPWAS